MTIRNVLIYLAHGALAAFLISALNSASMAQAPERFSIQGTLIGGDGKPVSGQETFVFALYDVATGDTALWQETQQLQIVDGLYEAELGSVVSIPSALANQQLFLGITVGTDSEMTPRSRLNSVPYALRSATVAPEGVGSTEIVDGSIGADDIDTQQVQARISGLCPQGTFLTGVSEQGIGNCVAPAGDIEEVGAGDGLSGGGTQGAVTLSADYTEIQARLAAACPAGEALRGIAQDGTPDCVAIGGSEGPNVTQTFISQQFSDIRSMGLANGNPVAVGVESPSPALSSIMCLDEQCSAYQLNAIAPISGGARTFDVAAAGTASPVIAWTDSTGLWLVRCNDIACSGSDETVTQVFSGSYDTAEVAVGSDGFPRILTRSPDTSENLYVVCNDLACAGNDEASTPLGFSSISVDLQLAADGTPYMSIFGSPGTIERCDNGNCSVRTEVLSVSRARRIGLASGNRIWFSANDQIERCELVGDFCTNFEVLGRVASSETAAAFSDDAALMLGYDSTARRLEYVSSTTGFNFPIGPPNLTNGDVGLLGGTAAIIWAINPSLGILVIRCNDRSCL